MAVFTQIPFSELEGFAARYDIGALEAAEPIAEGTENTNYKLLAACGPYILTVFERRTPAEDLPFFIALMRHLAAKGVAVPKPVADRAGCTLQTLAHKPALIVSFLPGRPRIAPAPADCAALGAALADMHMAGLDFPVTRSNPLGPRAWPPLWETCRAESERAAAPLRRPVEEALARVARDWPQHLRRGIVHSDLFPDNVFFKGSTISGLIDFYFSCTDFLAYDLAVAVASWCFDGANRFVPASARAMVTGYEGVRPLGGDERAALPLLATGAALRFTLTRLYDRLFPAADAMVTPKDPEQFAARLGHFLNDPEAAAWLGAARAAPAPMTGAPASAAAGRRP